MTESEFIKKFKPDVEPDGSLSQWWPSCEAIRNLLDVAERERRVWTMIEEDGKLALLQGYHIVNRLYYVICDNPYPKDKKIEVKLD